MKKFFFYDTNIVNLLSESEKPSGGAAVQSSVWAEGLSAIGNEVSIATYKDEAVVLKPEFEHIQLIPLYDTRKGLRWVRWATYRFPHIVHTLRRIRPDYLYESVPSWVSFFTGVICKILKINYIIRLSSDALLDERYLTRYGRISQLFLKLGIQTSDYVLCQNDYQFNMMKRLFPQTKTFKIYNPFKIKDSEQLTPENKKYIAWVANFRLLKNLKLLYEIAVLLDDEKFKIAGSYIDPHPEVDKYLTKLRSLKNVEFVGYIERHKILDFLSKAKYLLNTSHYEGFSNTYLEAMSVGTPVLTTSNANPDQIINKNNLGIIYENSADLKLKLNTLSNLDYKQLSDQSIEYIKNNHDHIQLSKTLVKFLEEESDIK